nr:hypothetical protein [Tanacetum cinerariifolium]
DWVSDSEDESETTALQNVPSFVQTSEKVKNPRHSVQPAETSISIATPKLTMLTQSKPISITAVRPVSAIVPKFIVTSNSPPRVTGAQAPVVSVAQGNMSYLSDFEELNGGYVAFGGNPKGGKITGKRKIKIGKLDFKDVYFVKELKFTLFSVSQMCDKKNSVLFTYTECLVLSPDFKLSDESQVLLRVPRENNITPSIGFMRPFGYPMTIFNTLDPLGKFEGKVDEGFLVGFSVNSSGPTWLFDIDSLTRTMNYQPVIAGNQTNPSAGFQDKFDAEKAGEKVDQQYVLFPMWYSGSTNPQTYDGDVAFDENKHDAKKPQFEVNVSPSSSAQLGKQDDKTKKKAKGKSPVESSTGYRHLSAEFEDCSENSSNEVNAVGSIVSTVGKNSLNITNPFSADGPLKTTASLTHGQSLFKDASQPTDDPDIPELDDITYSDDDNDVGAEADFNNLETSITVKQKKDGIFISKDKYVAEILKKFRLTKEKSASTPIDIEKPLLKDPDGEDVDVHIYRSMIGSLMYLTSSRPDIMFAVCACAHFQVTLKASHLYAVNKIFRYLNGKPHLGLWYPKDSPFDLVAYSDSDYAGASLDRKSTTRGCQFLGCRLIFWQCKKQTVVATSSTEAEYVAATSCCA